MKTNPKHANALTDALALTDVDAVMRAMWNTPGLAGDDGVPRMGLNVLFEAAPGRGKSARIRAATRRAGLRCETVIASLREPADFLRWPVPQADGSVTYLPPAWAKRAAAHEHAVVFFDELNAAPAAVQMALFRVVLEGAVGDVTLPSSVRFIGAQNDTASCAGRFALDPALVNRFIILPWPGTNAQGWAQWLLNPEGANDPGEVDDPGEVTDAVLKAWPAVYARAAGIVAAFITRRADLLETDPTDDGKPYTTPRSWEVATRAFGGATLHGLSPADTDAVIAGAVGLGAAREFSAFRSALDLPDPVAVLDGAGFKHDPARLDRTMATLSSCASVVMARDCDKRPKRVDTLLRIMLDVANAHAADAVVIAAKSLLGRDNAHRGVVMSAPSFVKTFQALEPYTGAAGMGSK